MGEENLISVVEAAQRLGVSRIRVLQLITDNRLPARKIGTVYVIREADLALVSDRKPGRPKKADEAALAELPITLAEMKAGEVVKTPAKATKKRATRKASGC